MTPIKTTDDKVLDNLARRCKIASLKRKREPRNIMLWLLRPRDFLPDDDNPWNPWYDKCFGFVIRADSEEEARELANENGRDENRGEFLNKKVAHTTSPWLDERYSTCNEVPDIGPSKIIMQDSHAA